MAKHIIKFKKRETDEAVVVDSYHQTLHFPVTKEMAKQLTVESDLDIEAQGVIEEIGSYGDEDYHVRMRLTSLSFEDGNQFEKMSQED